SAPWPRSGSEAPTRRLRALLHLVDVDSSRSDTDAANARVRARLVQSVEILLERLVAGPDASVHRILCATLARSLDAAVREGVFEPADVLLIVADHLVDRQSVATLAEASTHPDVCSATDTYAHFLDQHARPSPESVADATDTGSTLLRPEEATSVARRVARLGRISAGGTHRAEALRQALLRLGRALELVAAARGMSDLVPDASRDTAPLAEIEGAADALRQLLETTRRRALGRETHGSITVVTDVAPLSSLVERAASSGVPPNAQQLAMATAELVADLPEPLAHATQVVLARLAELPGQAPEDAGPILLGRRRAALPDWLLPRRVIGAFYVARALGSGGGSSVFIARRLEDRHEPEAEAFALKVPQYDPTTARSLSEQEFMQLFREEATALLALPQQENLARFVTFDLAARPKPILVMELIRGVSLERLIRSRSLTTKRAFDYLDGILAGLSTMHAAGVGHLDVKPSNVILRDGDTPVLVDFGLSGRQLRPGCGTLEYCAPEVLGLVPEGHTPSPMAVDLYAIGALAFELLTGRQLFDADDETQLAAQHVAHDGWPAPLAVLAEEPQLSEVAIVLAACLRRDPRQRATVDALRAKLRTVGRVLVERAWPVDERESFAPSRG
ncbi:MAG TPA: serine/threonine-protein kinase, partial [Polyangiaceae bacterium]|nr:serine/threonine-protein kinase [Polyangiaceae bacterium]